MGNDSNGRWHKSFPGSHTAWKEMPTSGALWSRPPTRQALAKKACVYWVGQRGRQAWQAPYTAASSGPAG